MSELKSCLLCGVGGQGTVLASRILAQAAMNKGLRVRTAETIGMAQRGGCVVSHVRMGDEVPSSLIPLKKADIIIGFEPGETVRCLPYLKENGVVITCRKIVAPVTASLSGMNYNAEEMIDFLKEKVQNLILIDSEKICNECGSAKVTNVALLGAVANCNVLPVEADDIKNTLTQKIKPAFIEMNLKAFSMGAECQKE